VTRNSAGPECLWSRRYNDGGGSGAGELGDGLLGAGVVDQALALRCGCHQRGGGCVVERPGQPVGIPVQASGGIVSDERVGPAGFSELRNPRGFSAVMAVRHRLAGT
jgi:hypothetical protein